MLEIEEITKFYRNIPVVDCVSFRVAPGEVTGYLGPNGSGKSTTVKIITTLIEPSAGRVLLDGQDVRRDLVGFKQRLGYVPEDANLYSHLSGLEYLQLVGRLRGLPEHTINRRTDDLLDLFLLHPHRHGSIATYSKGMRQRILIAAALIHNPDLLVLDEPLSGMDASSTQLFKHVLGELASRGKMVLYISHVMEIVERVCARVIIIHQGKIVANDSVDRLREWQGLASLDQIFSQLTERRDLPTVARQLVNTLRWGDP